MPLHIKTTKKEILKRSRYVLSVDYCALQDLLSGFMPDFYTCGIYGWNADIYVFDNISICTGYRPFGIDVDYELINHYNTIANGKSQEERYELIKEFMREALKVHFPNNNIIIR